MCWSRKAAASTTTTDCRRSHHREHTWLGASRDGLVAPEGLLEIKCPVHQLHAAVPREYMA